MTGKHDKVVDQSSVTSLLLTGPIVIRGLSRGVKDTFRPGAPSRHRAFVELAETQAAEHGGEGPQSSTDQSATDLISSLFAPHEADPADGALAAPDAADHTSAPTESAAVEDVATEPNEGIDESAPQDARSTVDTKESFSGAKAPRDDDTSGTGQLRPDSPAAEEPDSSSSQALIGPAAHSALPLESRQTGDVRAAGSTRVELRRAKSVRATTLAEQTAAERPRQEASAGAAEAVAHVELQPAADADDLPIADPDETQVDETSAFEDSGPLDAPTATSAAAPEGSRSEPLSRGDEASHDASTSTDVGSSEESVTQSGPEPSATSDDGELARSDQLGRVVDESGAPAASEQPDENSSREAKPSDHTYPQPQPTLHASDPLVDVFGGATQPVTSTEQDAVAAGDSAPVVTPQRTPISAREPADASAQPIELGVRPLRRAKRTLRARVRRPAASDRPRRRVADAPPPRRTAFAGTIPARQVNAGVHPEREGVTPLRALAPGSRPRTPAAASRVRPKGERQRVTQQPGRHPSAVSAVRMVTRGRIAHSRRYAPAVKGLKRRSSREGSVSVAPPGQPQSSSSAAGRAPTGPRLLAERFGRTAVVGVALLVTVVVAGGVIVSTAMGARNGVAGAPAAQVAAPRPIVAVIGDETVTRAGAGVSSAQRWPQRLATALGADIVVLASDANSSYSGSDAFQVAAGRVPTNARAVVFIGGATDANAEPIDLAKAATSAFSVAKQRAPRADILVVGPLFDDGSGLQDLRNALHSSASIADAAWLDPIASGWLPAVSSTAGLSAARSESVARHLKTAIGPDLR